MREVIHSQHESAARDTPRAPEHALAWSEKKFRTLIENSSDVIALTDAQGTILYKSPSIERILGFNPDELVGRSVFELAHPDDHEWLARLLDQLLAEPDKPLTGEFRHLHKNGTYVWMEGVVSNMLAEPAIQAMVCNFRDITERKKAEEALRASASRLRLALQSARMGFYERDVAANKATCDEQCRAILSLPEDVSDPAVFRDLIHPEDRAFVRRTVERMLNPGIRKMAKGEFRIRRSDGEVRWVAASGCALFDDSLSPPRPVTLMGVVQDITDRKLAEQALQQREAHLRVMTETMPAVPWSATPEGHIDYFSDKWLEWTGLSREEALNNGWKRVVHPAEVPQIFEAARRSMRTGDPFDIKHRLRRADGCYRWHRSRALPQRDQAGRVVRWYGITDDIHELIATLEALEQSEEQLREREQRLRLALETAALGSYERNLNTGFVTMDEGLRTIMGLPEGRPEPEVAYKALYPEDRDRVLAAVGRAYDPVLREICGAEFRILRPDGQVRWVAGRGRVVFDDTVTPTRPLKFLGVLQDITERKLAERELEEARERLARANQDLERTVAERTAQLREAIAELEHMSYTIIHDMRAPLRAMMGYSELVRFESEACLSERSKDFLQQIMASAARMDLLITDALNYNRAVRTNLPLAPVDTGRLLASMLKSYPEFQPPRAQIQLEGAFPTVLGNEAGLTQVFSNLLNNAVKFVKPGEVPRVRIWAERMPEAQGAPMVRLWFQDNGVGIPGEGQERIFDMFQRLHGSDYEGTGIGLALVRKVVERMGGCVGVESQPGQGSRFWVELRAARN